MWPEDCPLTLPTLELRSEWFLSRVPREVTDSVFTNPATRDPKYKQPPRKVGKHKLSFHRHRRKRHLLAQQKLGNRTTESTRLWVHRNFDFYIKWYLGAAIIVCCDVWTASKFEIWFHPHIEFWKVCSNYIQVSRNTWFKWVSIHSGYFSNLFTQQKRCYHSSAILLDLEKFYI